MSPKVKLNPHLLFMLIISILTAMLAYRYLLYTRANRVLEVTPYNWQKLSLILSQIDNSYVDSVNYKDITEAVIPYILEQLDPHSVYLPPVELKYAEEQLEGNFDGIGVQFNVPNDTAIVISAITGGPSEKVGIISGDRLVNVNGENIAGVKIDQDSIVSKLKGPSGSMVRVGVKRNGVEELIYFDIKRDKIPTKSVDVAYMINDTTGFIRLIRFSKTTYSEFMQSTNELLSQGMKSLILDLRGNPGGYFDQALRLSNEFLERGELIVYMEGLHRKREDYYADNSGKLKHVGLKILIDENSASSSEILAGAIQDNDRGTIIGRRSYGKGLMQEPIYFSDNSGMRLTVARFYTPTGRSIQKPYAENYRYDIYERFIHGEMTDVDSIKRNDSLRYETPGGKIVYGGGGIIPDIFVPLERASSFYMRVGDQSLGLTFRFGVQMADLYRERLNEIKSLTVLKEFFATIEFGERFLSYAASHGVVPGEGEWEESREQIINDIMAYIGRYSPLGDDAFFPILFEKDNTVIAAIGQ